jgi:hypothetical protein
MPNKLKNKKTLKKSNNASFDAVIACEKKNCAKERRLTKKKHLKCNSEESQNHKFDKYNQVKITYDWNPLHFPFNKIKSSPCLTAQHKLLNDPYIALNKCINAKCKKENKEWMKSISGFK